MNPACTGPVGADRFLHVTGVEGREGVTPPIDETLTRLVLLMRLLGWVWMVALALTELGNTDSPPGRPSVLYGAIALATVSTILMLVASRFGFLRSGWYVILDGAMAFLVLGAAWAADASDFVAGGIPMSWLFLVAFASRFVVVAFTSLAFTVVFALIHQLMGLSAVRIVGSVQFLVIGLIVSWAIDALRLRERLRLEAEAETRKAQAALDEERDLATRLEERSEIARRLHDSVLQTLKLIMSNSSDESEVRYLARVQERELRRTINEYRSPYVDGFRARLLDARANVEDRYRVEIEQVIRGDVEVTSRIEGLVWATHEALSNAARHSGEKNIDLFAEVLDDGIQVNVRDRGRGFSTEPLGSGIKHSIVDPLERIGANVKIKSVVGFGTDVSIFLPAP